MLTEIPAKVTTPDVFLHWFHYFLFIALDFAIAYRIANFIKSKYPKLITKKFLDILLISSSFILLYAGIGKVGWSIQTWAGDTTPENVNNAIFQVLTFLGGFLLFTYLILIVIKEDN